MSTRRQAQQGESLDVQESICRNIAAGHGWKLGHEPWRENFSGRKDVRPVFEDILAFLDEHPGEVRYYIFRAIDRFTRGGTYSYEQMKRALDERGVALIDSYGIIQPAINTLEDTGFEYRWSRQSPSEITEVVLATTAKQEITTILTRLIGQEIRLTQKGYKMRAPDDGYRNAKVFVDGKKRTIQEPDPERAPFIRQMFAMREARELSDQEICDRLNAQGYRRRTFNRWDLAQERIIGQGGGGPLTPKRLQEIIKRPTYCGVLWETWTGWKPLRAAYPGLVSIETYNRANRGKRHIRETEEGLELLFDVRPDEVKRLTTTNPVFPYKNVVLCPACRRPFMASASRSRNGAYHPAYHCSRRHRRVALNKARFEAVVEGYVQGLRFRPEAPAWLREFAYQRYQEQQEALVAETASTRRKAADLEVEMSAIAQAFSAASSPAMRRELETRLEKLDAEAQAAGRVKFEMEVEETELDRFTRDLSRVLEHPSELLLDPQSRPQQEALFSIVFDGLPTLSEITAGTAKLSDIFRVSDASVDAESVFVRLRELRWNQWLEHITKWREVRHLLNLHPDDGGVGPCK